MFYDIQLGKGNFVKVIAPTATSLPILINGDTKVINDGEILLALPDDEIQVEFSDDESNEESKIIFMKLVIHIA